MYLSGQNQNLVPFIFSCACLYYNPMLHKSLHFNLHSYVLYWCWDCQISRRFKFNVICHCQQKMNLEQCSENRKCCWIKFLKDGMEWSFSYQIEGSFEVFIKKGKIIFGYIFPRVIIKSKLFVYSLNAWTNLYLLFLLNINLI